MKRIIVVAPHPDDETLGCGGTLLRARAENAYIVWVIVTQTGAHLGATPEQVAARAQTIKDVAEAYSISEVVEFGFPAATLDTVPLSDIISKMSDTVRRVEPTDIYLPYPRDAHSDHKAVFDASISVSKWFRYPSVLRVFVYETQSETDFDLSPDSPGFRPNVFVDISATFDEKIRIAAMFESEFSEHPFPRSLTGIEALAILRGAASGFHKAEAFMLLRERIIEHEGAV